MVLVRRIRPGEADTVRRVRLAALSESPSAFGSTYAGELALTTEDWVERARAGAAGSERATFFAVAGAEIVGLVGGCRLEPASAVVELVSMWADPNARRRGIGRLLVEAVLDWARACGAGEVQLWVTRGNTAAEALYRRMGFTETGDHQPLPSDPCRGEIRMIASLHDPGSCGGAPGGPYGTQRDAAGLRDQPA